MLRKAKQLFRKNRFIHGSVVEITRDRISENDPVAIFKEAFIRSFSVFRGEAQLLAKGDTHIDDTWVDILGKEGLGISVAVTVGIIGILGAAGVMTAVASAGAAIPIAVVGIIAGIAFYTYRNRVKLERFQHAAAAMERASIETDIEEIADLLAELYRMPLTTSTLKDAHRFGKECMEVIAREMLMNKNFSFDELLYTPSLQATFVRNLSQVSKHKMDMNINTQRKFNMRGMIGHSAYYCKETEEFYQTAVSKPKKYGVLLFDKKADLEAFEDILTRDMPNKEKWRLHRMRDHDVNLLRRSSMFRAARNDDVLEEDVKILRVTS